MDRNKIYKEKYLPKLIKQIQSHNLRLAHSLVNYDFKPLEIIPETTLLYGKVGAGKSTTAAFMMLEWVRHRILKGKINNECRFVSVPELLQEIRYCYDKKSQVSEKALIDHYKNLDFLVLDDFGVDKTTDWSFQILYMIIDYRYSNYKTTVYTMNLDLNALSQKLNDDRITSRIEHHCGENIIHFKNKSLRVTSCKRF